MSDWYTMAALVQLDTMALERRTREHATRQAGMAPEPPADRGDAKPSPRWRRPLRMVLSRGWPSNAT